MTKKCGKATVLPAAPAYTFGSRNDTKLFADPGPAPGDYAPALVSSNHRRGPGFGFGTSTRDQKPAEKTPAPAEYNPRDTKGRASSAYSLGSRLKYDYLRPKTPGPGAYDWTKAVEKVKPAVQGKTLADKWTPDKESERRPGPVDYMPTRQCRSAPAYSIKHRYDDTVYFPSPGPGEYLNPDRPSLRGSAAFSIGAKGPSKGADNGVPGPGYYCCDSGPRVGTPSYSIGKSQRPSHRDDNKPGPGQYFTKSISVAHKGYAVVSEQKTAPAISFAWASRPDPRPDGTPAPGDYEPSTADLKSAPAYSLHGVHFKDGNKGPGPGHYHPELADKEVKPSNPAPSIAHRLEPPSGAEHRPGPHHYDPKKPLKEPLPVSMKFRNEVPIDPTLPGPQDYVPRPPSATPAYTIAKRFPYKDVEVTPGPGHYDVACDTLGVAARDVCLNDHCQEHY